VLLVRFGSEEGLGKPASFDSGDDVSVVEEGLGRQTLGGVTMGRAGMEGDAWEVTMEAWRHLAVIDGSESWKDNVMRRRQRYSVLGSSTPATWSSLVVAGLVGSRR